MGSKEESSMSPPTPQGQTMQLGFRTTATKDSDTASSVSALFASVCLGHLPSMQTSVAQMATDLPNSAATAETWC